MMMKVLHRIGRFFSLVAAGLLIAVVVAAAVALVVALVSAPVWLFKFGWNYVAVNLLHLPAASFWQAAGMLFLTVLVAGLLGTLLRGRRRKS